MMKKWIAILLILALCAFGAATAEEAEIAEGIRLFDSEWMDGSAHIMCSFEADLCNVHVWNDSGNAQWEYLCAYDPDQKALISLPDYANTKYVISAKEEGGDPVRTVEYSDGMAVFTLEDGKLVWEDGKENAGAGRSFQKVGWYIGDWDCEGPDGSLYQLTFFWDVEETEEEAEKTILHAGYKAVVEKKESNGGTTIWNYAGAYNEDTNTIAVFGVKEFQKGEGEPVETLNYECEAEFTMVEGQVYWIEAVEDAGAGLVFDPSNG